MADFTQETSDDVARMGKAFGRFIADVGRGIAETQRDLDVNSAAISTQLAATEIEVPAVVEQVLDADGTPSSEGNAVNVLRQKMSLIQFIVPTFYQWRHVQLNLSFDVEEIGAIEDFKIKRRTKNESFLGIGTTSTRTTTTSGTLSASDIDRADGSVDARLEPRPDITPPAPFLFRTGPTINFIPGGDVLDDNGVVIGADLTMLVLTADGSPNPDQQLKVSVNQGRLVATSGLTTNPEGQVPLRILKIDPEADQQLTTTVNVALGIVTARMDIRI